MYGTMKQIKWLFKVYKKETVKEVFLKDPVPIYTWPIFYFIKNIVLKLRKKKLDEKNISKVFLDLLDKKKREDLFKLSPVF